MKKKHQIVPFSKVTSDFQIDFNLYSIQILKCTEIDLQISNKSFIFVNYNSHLEKFSSLQKRLIVG